MGVLGLQLGHDLFFFFHNLPSDPLLHIFLGDERDLVYSILSCDEIEDLLPLLLGHEEERRRGGEDEQRHRFTQPASGIGRRG